jgi:hypothetical protein
MLYIAMGLIVAGITLLITGQITYLGGWPVVKEFLKEEGIWTAAHISILVAVGLLIISIGGDWHNNLWYPFYMDYDNSIWRLLTVEG